jgi:FecR protein
MNQSVDQRVARALAPPSALEEVPLTGLEKEFAIDAVAAALEARRTLLRPPLPSASRPVRQWVAPVVLCAMAAAVLLSVGGATFWRSSTKSSVRVMEVGLATATNEHGSRLVTEGDELGAGERLKTPAEGRLVLRFIEGTSLALSAKTDLLVDSVGAQRHFMLRDGRVSASVVKLATGERFVIATPQAQVDVRGTHFAVEVKEPSEDCRGGATVVTVDEGVVAVTTPQGEVLVRAGGRETVGCASQKPEMAAAPVIPAPRNAAPVSSSLTRMNAHYARALALKREGKLGAAVKALREFRESFPMGPLDEAAAVEELRILEHLDQKAARAAANEYLGNYPGGYARDIAERLSGP